jgi:hypothetical protein
MVKSLSPIKRCSNRQKIPRFIFNPGYGGPASKWQDQARLLALSSKVVVVEDDPDEVSWIENLDRGLAGKDYDSDVTIRMMVNQKVDLPLYPIELTPHQ